MSTKPAQVHIKVTALGNPRDAAVQACVLVGLIALLAEVPGWKATAATALCGLVGLALLIETAWRWMVAPPVENDPLSTAPVGDRDAEDQTA